MKIAKYVVLIGAILILMSSIVFGITIKTNTGGVQVATKTISLQNNKDPFEFTVRSNGTSTTDIDKSINQFYIDDVLFIDEIGATLASPSTVVTESALKFKWNTSATPSLEIYYRDATGTLYLMAIEGVAQ